MAAACDATDQKSKQSKNAALVKQIMAINHFVLCVWHSVRPTMLYRMLGFLPQRRIAGTDAKMSGI
jgi:hypothetical protein